MSIEKKEQLLVAMIKYMAILAELKEGIFSMESAASADISVLADVAETLKNSSLNFCLIYEPLLNLIILLDENTQLKEQILKFLAVLINTSRLYGADWQYKYMQLVSISIFNEKLVTNMCDAIYQSTFLFSEELSVMSASSSKCSISSVMNSLNIANLLMECSAASPDSRLFIYIFCFNFLVEKSFFYSDSKVALLALKTINMFFKHLFRVSIFFYNRFLYFRSSFPVPVVSLKNEFIFKEFILLLSKLEFNESEAPRVLEATARHFKKFSWSECEIISFLFYLKDKKEFKWTIIHVLSKMVSIDKLFQGIISMQVAEIELYLMLFKIANQEINKTNINEFNLFLSKKCSPNNSFMVLCYYSTYFRLTEFSFQIWSTIIMACLSDSSYLHGILCFCIYLELVQNNSEIAFGKVQQDIVSLLQVLPWRSNELFVHVMAKLYIKIFDIFDWTTSDSVSIADAFSKGLMSVYSNANEDDFMLDFLKSIIYKSAASSSKLRFATLNEELCIPKQVEDAEAELCIPKQVQDAEAKLCIPKQVQDTDTLDIIGVKSARCIQFYQFAGIYKQFSLISKNYLACRKSNEIDEFVIFFADLLSLNQISIIPSVSASNLKYVKSLFFSSCKLDIKSLNYLWECLKLASNYKRWIESLITALVNELKLNRNYMALFHLGWIASKLKGDEYGDLIEDLKLFIMEQLDKMKENNDNASLLFTEIESTTNGLVCNEVEDSLYSKVENAAQDSCLNYSCFFKLERLFELDEFFTSKNLKESADFEITEFQIDSENINYKNVLSLNRFPNMDTYFQIIYALYKDRLNHKLFEYFASYTSLLKESCTNFYSFSLSVYEYLLKFSQIDIRMLAGQLIYKFVRYWQYKFDVIPFEYFGFDSLKQFIKIYKYEIAFNKSIRCCLSNPAFSIIQNSEKFDENCTLSIKAKRTISKYYLTNMFYNLSLDELDCADKSSKMNCDSQIVADQNEVSPIEREEGVKNDHPVISKCLLPVIQSFIKSNCSFFFNHFLIKLEKDCQNNRYLEIINYLIPYLSLNTRDGILLMNIFIILARKNSSSHSLYTKIASDYKLLIPLPVIIPRDPLTNLYLLIEQTMENKAAESFLRGAKILAAFRNLGLSIDNSYEPYPAAKITFGHQAASNENLVEYNFINELFKFNCDLLFLKQMLVDKVFAIKSMPFIVHHIYLKLKNDLQDFKAVYIKIISQIIRPSSSLPDIVHGNIFNETKNSKMNIDSGTIKIIPKIYSSESVHLASSICYLKYHNLVEQQFDDEFLDILMASGAYLEALCLLEINRLDKSQMSNHQYKIMPLIAWNIKNSDLFYAFPSSDDIYMKRVLPEMFFEDDASYLKLTKSAKTLAKWTLKDQSDTKILDTDISIFDLKAEKSPLKLNLEQLDYFQLKKHANLQMKLHLVLPATNSNLADETTNRLLVCSKYFRHLRAYKDAQSCINQLKISNKENFEIYAEEAKVLQGLGRYDVALKVLEKGFDMDNAKCQTFYYLGKIHSSVRSLNGADIYENYFKHAISNASDTRHLYKARIALGKMAFQQYSELKDQDVVGSNALDSVKMNLKNASFKSRVEEKAYADLNAQINEKMKENQRIRNNLTTFMILALENIALALTLTNKYDLEIFKLVSIWFENYSCPITSKIIAASSIPVEKYLLVKYQLIAKWAGDSAHGDGGKIISKILSSILLQEPLSIIYEIQSQIYLEQRKRKHSEEIDVARNLLASVCQKSLAFRDLWSNVFKLCEAYLELSHLDEEAVKSKGRNLKIYKLKDLHGVPPITSSSTEIAIQSFKYPPTVLQGINLPKLIECVGTDGHSYSQIVKGKDELRQDAIVEQLFHLANIFLLKNAESRKRQLKIRTFKIVSFHPISGVMEYVPNTLPIGKYLVQAHESINKDDWTAKQCNDYMRKLFESKEVSLKSKIEAFNLKICPNFKPVFRHFFFENFLDSASWFIKRERYVKSVATCSMFGYLIGLGDRHAQNILLDKSTAELIQIDLNMIFEQGRLLRIPELVPFRLTRDIVDAMGITGCEGSFKKSCECILDAIKKNADLLMAQLEVFKYDPLYKWQLSPVKAQIINNNLSNLREQEKENFENYLKADLMNDAEKALIKIKKKLCSEENGTYLSTAGHVNYLIQMATDPELLCQMYPGWQPWL